MPKSQSRWKCWGHLCVLLLAAPTYAEVVDADTNGFISRHTLVLAAPPQRAYEVLTQQIHLWWDASHSYGANAQAFSMDARAGGCFCETLPGGGSVEHMRVVNVQPGASLTLRGALGPLQEMGVAGSMQFVFEPHAEGSLLTYRYSVGGYYPGGLNGLAQPVDQVQLGQLQRLQRFIAGGGVRD